MLQSTGLQRVKHDLVTEQQYNNNRKSMRDSRSRGLIMSRGKKEFTEVVQLFNYHNFLCQICIK